MGCGSRDAQLELLGLLREGVQQWFKPSPARLCLNHPGRTGRNGSRLLPGQAVSV